MILVDIEMPSTGEKYDFRLDENTYIGDLIEEIGGLLIASTEMEGPDQMKEMLLCDYENRRILPLDSTLKQCGIRSGWKLILL